MVMARRRGIIMTTKGRVYGEILIDLEERRKNAADVRNNDKRIEAYSEVIKVVRKALKDELGIPENEDYTGYLNDGQGPAAVS